MASSLLASEILVVSFPVREIIHYYYYRLISCWLWANFVTSFAEKGFLYQNPTPGREVLITDKRLTPHHKNRQPRCHTSRQGWNWLLVLSCYVFDAELIISQITPMHTHLCSSLIESSETWKQQNDTWTKMNTTFFFSFSCVVCPIGAIGNAHWSL